MSARCRWTVGTTIGWIVGMACAGIASAQTPPALLPEPESFRIDKNKFISFSFPDAPEGTQWAVRLTLVKLYNTDPADTENEACPPRRLDLPELSVFEGQIRWIGLPASFCDGVPFFNPPFRFLGALTQCCPGFRDWNTELDVFWDQECVASLATGFCTFGHAPCLQDSECPQDPILHVYGGAMVPCSEYKVELVDLSCPDVQDEACYSDPLTLHTAKWADVTPPFGGSSQPNFTDIGYEVDAFRNLTTTTRVQAFLRENVAPVALQTNFTDIGHAVDGFKSIWYPEVGPAECLESCE